VARHCATRCLESIKRGCAIESAARARSYLGGIHLFRLAYWTLFPMTTSNEDLVLGFGVGAEARDKSVPWYKADIGEIPKPARELLEKYSGIAPDSVASHVYKVVSHKPFLRSTLP
jgi:hypothetical protein